MSSVSCSSVDDVVSFAIQKEEKAMDFYRQCAQRTKNKGLKEFFNELMKEEERHRDLLRALDPASLSGVKLQKVEDLHISDYLQDMKFSDDLTYQEALTLAMKSEEKAYAFYVAWQNRCMHEKTGKLFEMLAHEELKHKRNLEARYDDDILTWD